MEYLKLYLSLYVSPLRAMSRIIDEGNWWHGALVAIVVSLLFQFTVSNFLHNTYEVAPISATELAQRPKIAPPKVEPDDPEAA